MPQIAIKIFHLKIGHFNFIIILRVNKPVLFVKISSNTFKGMKLVFCKSVELSNCNSFCSKCSSFDWSGVIV